MEWCGRLVGTLLRGSRNVLPVAVFLLLMTMAAVTTVQAAQPPSGLEFPLSPQERLLEAIRANDLEAAQQAVADGADLKGETTRPLAGFSSPLVEAIRHADPALTQWLVTQGAAVCGETCEGPAIPYALQAYFAGHTELGNDLDRQPGGAVDPLVRAAANGELETFQKLEPEAGSKARADAARAAAAANRIAILKKLKPDHKTRSRLFADAAAAGALRTMEYLLENGVSLDKAGSKALERAARTDCVDAISFLLEKGVPPNGKEHDSGPLSVAILSGSTKAAARLIEAGASVSRRNDQGMTPLSRAVFRNNVQLVRLLLKHGADWNQPDQQQMTPLLLAASAHSPGSLALFLEHGADINATHPTLGSLLALAQRTLGEDSPLLILFPEIAIPRSSYQRMLDTVRLILDHHPRLINQPHPGFGATPLTPLAAAIVSGQSAIFNELLARGAKVNTADASGITPLLQALAPAISIPSQTAMVERLLAAGADPNLGIDLPLKPGGFPSPLKTAIAQQSFARVAPTHPAERQALVDRLLRHGARFATPKGSATEKMLFAATRGDLDALRSELAKGTSPNVADDRGWTPLMSALGLSHHAVAEALLEAGADAKARDASGLTPLWFAITGYAPKKTVERLLDLGAAPGTEPNPFGSPLAMAIMLRNDPALAELLLQRGADVHAAGVSGEGEGSLLGWAMLPDRAYFVPLLLRHGADPNQADGNETLLHLAIQEKLPEAVAQLLTAGADPLKTNGQQQTVLEAARASGDPHIVKLVETAAANRKRRSD